MLMVNKAKKQYILNRWNSLLYELHLKHLEAKDEGMRKICNKIM